MIYIAAPYTDKSSFVVNIRSLLVSQVTHHLIKTTDKHYYSPISHGHYIENSVNDSVIEYSKWMAHGLKILNHCDKMIVLDFPGTENSKGVNLEIEYCNAMNIPIEYISTKRIKLMPEVSTYLLETLEKHEGKLK